MAEEALFQKVILLPFLPGYSPSEGVTLARSWDGHIIGAWIQVTSTTRSPDGQYGIEGSIEPWEGIHQSVDMLATVLRRRWKRLDALPNPILFRCTPSMLGLLHTRPGTKLPRSINNYWEEQRREGGDVPEDILPLLA